MTHPPVRVRIAPSPTGYLHIGTARTALFNWLFARKYNGKFFLRIEDTDRERSDKEYENDIISSLQWLGLTSDDDIVYQSKRSHTYARYLQKILDENKAYYCFCTKDDLEKERQKCMKSGRASVYGGTCSSLSLAEIESLRLKNMSSVIRLRVPDREISFSDMIRGNVSFHTEGIGDMVIAKDVHTPLYHFAVVVDDEEMAISHVIRGEDHIANTPKQILIQESLGFKRPLYAHLPLILDSQRAKMSKRFAATSVGEYAQQGYLPEALVNFLLLLGWHPHDDRELFTREDMIRFFDLERVQKGGAVFDIKKLQWMNAEYIRSTDDDSLVQMLNIEPSMMNKKIVTLLKERLVTLNDYPQLASFFSVVPEYDADMLVWKKSDKETTRKNLEYIFLLGTAITQEQIMKLADERGRGDVLWPLRVALSGQEASPGPFEIMKILGIDESLRRIRVALDLLE